MVKADNANRSAPFRVCPDRAPATGADAFPVRGLELAALGPKIDPACRAQVMIITGADRSGVTVRSRICETLEEQHRRRRAMTAPTRRGREP